MNYLLPRDIINEIIQEEISGLAAVPPLWIQLAQLNWDQVSTLRYITNSGGAMPRATLDQLRRVLPKTSVFLMYGLTEAFRSTFLPPGEVDRRPDSVSNTQCRSARLREDGSLCA